MSMQSRLRAAERRLKANCSACRDQQHIVVRQPEDQSPIRRKLCPACERDLTMVVHVVYDELANHGEKSA